MSILSSVIRLYKGESDLQLLIDLFDACEAVDRVEFQISIPQLRLALAAPGIDRNRDLMLWEDPKGKLIGFGHLSIAAPIKDNLADGTLFFAIHPLARGSNLETQIIIWAENRLYEIAEERQGKPKLFTWSISTRIEHIAIIKHHGFVESRPFFNLSRSLKSAIIAPQLPEGFTIRSVEGERDAQAWVDLHNLAFLGEWNYHPMTVESFKHLLKRPDYLPELNLVAIDSTGKFASACYGSIDPVHNTFTGRQEGWIFFLFTSPDFQRRGLARAMLFHALARLKALNMDVAKIGVDAENAFGAVKLYESVGFQHFRTNTAYVKQL
jgi:mycothiol synthase